MSYSREERLSLSSALEQAGPDAPTLCAGWSTRDLAAHLVLREHRPDASAGVLGGPLAGYTARMLQRLERKLSYPQLIETFRSGPPRLSVFGIPGMDERGNAVEYFIHHEDVRRAEPGWEPRKLSPGLSDLLWRRLRMTRFLLRKAPVGVELARDDVNGDGQAFRMTVRKGVPVVTVIGSPAELTMWATGRTRAARVRMDGAEAAVAALASSSWHL